jgi:hypothetical protein
MCDSKHERMACRGRLYMYAERGSLKKALQARAKWNESAKRD